MHFQSLSCTFLTSQKSQIYSYNQQMGGYFSVGVYFPDRTFFSNSTHTCSIEITVTDVDEEEQRKNQKHISKSVYI